MIKGKLVGLRAIERDDLVLLRNWSNIPEFRKNFREERELSIDHKEKWYERSCIESPNDLMFTIVDLEDNITIGACGLLYINWIIRSADFSFYIGKDSEYIDNNGYAYDAATLLIEYGFKNLNLHKIWMELYEFDTLKIDFFQNRFNFKLDATLRDNCFEDGKYWNSLIISLINN